MLAKRQIDKESPGGNTAAGRIETMNIHEEKPDPRFLAAMSSEQKFIGAYAVNDTTMKLIGNSVLIEPLPKKTVTPTGVVLPPHPRYQDDPVLFRVIAVGPGKTVRNKRTKVRTLVPPEVAPGDRVLLETAWGNKWQFEDGKIIVDADYILMKW